MTIEELLKAAENALFEHEKIVGRWTKAMVDSNYTLEPDVSEYTVALRNITLTKSMAYSQLAHTRMQYEIYNSFQGINLV